MITWRGETETEAGFKDEFALLGYTPQYTISNCGQDPEKLEQIVEKISLEKPDLIYSFGTTVTLAVMEKVSDTPIICVMVANPDRTGVMPSRAGSGRNVAGVTHATSEVSLLKALLTVAPVQRVGILYNSLEANSQAEVTRYQNLCVKAGVDLIESPVQPGDDLEAAAYSLLSQKIEAVILPSDSLIVSQGRKAVDVFNAARIPTVAALEPYVVEMGALFGLVVAYEQVGREAARLADSILQGQDPADIPLIFIRPAYVVNLHTEEQIGVPLPPEIKASARKVNN